MKDGPTREPFLCGTFLMPQGVIIEDAPHHSERHGDFMPAGAATEKVLTISPSANRRESRSRFTFDPATGALIVSPDLDAKICKALRRDARRFQLSLFFRRFRLEGSYLTLQTRLALLRVDSKLFRNFANFRFRRHG